MPWPSTRSRSAATRPSPARPPTGRTSRSTSTGTARCSTASSRPRTARTARSASAAPAAPRSAAPAACASTASPTWPATRTSTRRPRPRTDGVDHRRADGQHAVLKDLIVDMDAVHWKKIQRVTPWLLPEGDAARARVHRAAGVDDRRHADDGLHPVRRLRLGLPVDGGRPAVHRPGRAGQGLPLRRRPARRPARASACKDLAEDPHGIYDCTHCFNCIEACPKGVAPMSQIMRLRRIAGADHEHRRPQQRPPPRDGVRQEHRAATACCTRPTCCRDSYGGKFHPRAVPELLELAAGDPARAAARQGDAGEARCCTSTRRRRRSSGSSSDIHDRRTSATSSTSTSSATRTSEEAAEPNEGRLLARLREPRLHPRAARLDGARSPRCWTSSWSSSTAPAAAAPA